MKNDITLNEEFEKFIHETYPPNTYNLNKVNGMYSGEKVALLYAVFKRCYKDCRKFFKAPHSKINIVARTEGGKLKFNDNVYVHHKLEDAETEAIRLAQKHKTRFHVFTKISTFTYEPSEINQK